MLMAIQPLFRQPADWEGRHQSGKARRPAISGLNNIVSFRDKKLKVKLPLFLPTVFGIVKCFVQHKKILQ